MSRTADAAVRVISRLQADLVLKTITIEQLKRHLAELKATLNGLTRPPGVVKTRYTDNPRSAEDIHD